MTSNFLNFIMDNMNADTLTATSREFYESSKAKFSGSLVILAGAMMVLGFCSEASGISDFNTIAVDNASGDLQDQYQALSSGYGFASFVYFVAFIVTMVAAIYISPLCCGSPNEKAIILKPKELDRSQSTYSDRPSQVGGQPEKNV
jgi:hypothetical protein